MSQEKIRAQQIALLCILYLSVDSTNKYQKYKSVELGDQQGSTAHTSIAEQIQNVIKLHPSADDLNVKLHPSARKKD